MGADALCGEYDFDWDSEDDREIESFSMPSSTSLVVPGALASSAKASMMAGSSDSKASDNFIRMGFDEKLVAEAIQEHGEKNANLILETLLKHSASSSASSPTSKMASSSASSPTSKMINHFIGMGFAEEQIAKAIKKNVDGDTDSILETLLTFQASMMAGSSDSKASDNFIRMGLDEKLVAEAIQEHGEKSANLILETLLKHSASSSASSPTSKMASSSASSPTSKMINHFIGMGFAEEQIAKAIKKNVDGDTDSILETLLTFQAIAESPQEDTPRFPEIDSDPISWEYEEHLMDGLSDMDSSEDEEITKLELGEDSKLTSLRRMGYSSSEASIAIKRCGPEATIPELVDFLHVAGMAKEDPAFYAEEVKPKPLSIASKHKKRGLCEYDTLSRRKQQRLGNEDEEILRLPNPMVGFGLPNESEFMADRHLPEAAIGPPFFYYENVALAPKGVWQTISRFLYDVEPEFVDSKFFCAAARKRGYVHNLPIRNRYPLLPLPPHTIHEALPMTRRWWPSWDQRTKLNCLQTCTASAKLTERIRKAIERYEGDPPLSVQKMVLEECRKWNLVWVGKNKLAPLEPDEVEMLLGFPRNHTRGGGISRTDRYKSLGNSFQVDTVAYHLSTLKDIFPEGLNLLSLFSGIGGAEVALHRLGIRLKNVVSVEISEVNRGIQSCWWEQTNQTGNLVHISDIQELNADRLEQLMESFGGFDLVIGGSPCNNLAGSNRHHRDGLEGKESSLFFDYFRLLDVIKNSTVYNR